MCFDIKKGRLVKYTGEDGYIDIPCEVKCIGKNAFNMCKTVQCITIPEGVTSIGASAFSGCENLSSIIIPDSVTSIGASAFLGCKNLSSVTIPEGVTSIGASTFSGCENLSSIAIPEGVTIIGASAFLDCKNLNSVTIPDSVTIIGASAFSGCKNLSSVTIPDGVTSIGERAFYYCEKLSSITIPEGVTSICAGAFSGCKNLSSVTIPDGVTSIGERAFSGCKNLSGVTIPDGVTSIGERAFSGCENLSSIAIPEGVTIIGASAFLDCKNLNSVTIPDSVTIIGASTFSGCKNLSSVTIPDSVTIIGASAFYYCEKLSSVTIPDGVASIGESTFSGCKNLSSITIPEGVTSIGASAFSDCKKLSGITIPEGVTSIGEHAFYGCESLSNVIIPDGVMNIGRYAFYECKDMAFIEFPKGADIDISNITEQLREKYKLAQKHYKASSESTPEFTIKNKVLIACHKPNGTQLHVPNGVEYIKSLVSKVNNGITSVFLPASVKYVDREAFWKCEKLTDIYIDNNEIQFEEYALCQSEPITIHVSNSMNYRLKQPLILLDYNWPKNVIVRSYEDSVGCAYVLINQKSKAWKNWLYDAVTNPDEVIRLAMEDVKTMEKIPSAVCSRIVEFMLFFKREMSDDVIESMVNVLEQKGVESLRGQFGLDQTEPGIQDELDEYEKLEALAHDQLRNENVDEHIYAKITKGVCYAGSERICSKEVVVFPINAYSKQWKSCRTTIPGEMGGADVLDDPTRVMICPEADRIAARLDQDALSHLLTKLVKQNSYRYFVIPWGRYVSEADMRLFVEQDYKNLIRGNARQRYQGRNMKNALTLNDSIAAMRFFESIGELDQYAAMRKTSASELRDTYLIPDLGFDADGIKRYDIGGSTIEVSVGSDLQLCLYDVGQAAPVRRRSFPKKSDDPAKLAACAEDYAALKKSIQAFVKERMILLRNLHISGEKVSNSLWNKVYCENAVLRQITPLIVWQDDRDNTFMLIDGKIVDCDMQPYAPGDYIHVAHIMNMKQDVVAKWQQILVRNGIKQPFAQMWEPVINWNPKEISMRYNEVVLSKTERDKMKKALVQRGVKVGAEAMDKEWDYSTWKYEFSNQSALFFGKSLRLEYKVDPKRGTTTFGEATIQSTNSATELNAIIFELDRAAILAHICADRDEVLTSDMLAEFTVAQISEFLNAAISAKSPKCTALLLDYKKTHFPIYADVEEFTLD